MDTTDEMAIYENDYDYDDIKVAVCIADRFKDWNLSADFEDIAQLVLLIKDNWCADRYEGCLTGEEFAYIQKYAYRFLDETKNKIMEELK